VLDVPAHIRDPDFIRAIIDKCFDRGVLKPKYSDRRYVCENAKDAIRINLDETLVKICYRTIKFGPKYCVLGYYATETFDERIDNFINTGIPDRKGIDINDDVNPDIISYCSRLKEKFARKNGKSLIRTGRVYLGKGQWQLVVVE